MQFLKQLFATILIFVFALFGWVYFFPNAIDTLARYNLDVGPLKSVAALNSAADSKSNTGNGKRQRRGSRQPLVITAPVMTGIINDRLTAIGSGRATQSVSVTPLVSGQIVDLPTTSGTVIEKGAVLAQLDSENEQLSLDKAKLAAEDLRAKAKRAEGLLAKRLVSPVEVDTARTALSAAELAVREAQLNLDRRTITSPIAGIVGIVTANVGDYVTNQSPIVTIDDRRKIVVEYFVPERFATAINMGAAIEASSVARPGKIFSGKVVAIDNRIDIASRTLRIRAEVENQEDILRAGMAFQVVMRFAGDSFPAVDPLAIQWDSRGSYVWQIGEDGKAKRQDARIVQRNAESVLVEAELKEGDRVVTEGIQNVRPGAKVLIAGEKPDQPTDINRRKEAGS